MTRPLTFCAALCAALLFTPHARAQDLYVGSNSSGVTTNFTSGTNAYVNTYIGLDPGANANTLNVLNTNTLLTNSGNVYVGDVGMSNRLTVADGGSVSAAALLSVGNIGNGNSVVITNGGRITSAGGEIGIQSSNNSVLVTGSNSVWTNSGSLAVGIYPSSGNSLVISNAGTVANNIGYIGFANRAFNNSVLVTETNSLWTNSSDLYVGYEGSGNRLAISIGGTVANTDGYVGGRASSSNNSVVVAGDGSRLQVIEDGSLWVSSSRLYVGYEGSGNSLVISNGGRIQNNAGVIGDFTNSLNNSVLVTGAASTWTNSGALTIAQRGSGTLTVASGGSVASSAITIASSNRASGTLNIGRFGTNDTGGTIIAPTIAFGAGTGVINFNQSDVVTITSRISGAGTINQLGGGATILSASNTYTGATTVSGGQLIVDGSIAGSTVTVNNGGTLTGSGAVGGIVLNLGSTINPGNSPGTQSVAGNVVWNAGANYNWQLYDTALAAGTGWDLVNATGTLDLSTLTVGSEFNINLWSLSAITPDASGPALNFDPNQNYTWTILTAAGGISGFTGSSQFDINIGAFNGTGGFANALNGGAFSLAQSGNDLNLVFTAAGGAPVPEPGTWAAAALLVGGAAFMRWRKRAKVA